VHPSDFGVSESSVDSLRGTDAAGTPRLYANSLREMTARVRDAVVLNAAAGLVALDESHEAPLVERIRSAMERARASIDSGAARMRWSAGWQ
jgi:anthranilate phosphoribosyltransferase